MGVPGERLERQHSERRVELDGRPIQWGPVAAGVEPRRRLGTGEFEGHLRSFQRFPALDWRGAAEIGSGRPWTTWRIC